MDIEQLEALTLAEDRSAGLDQLIPGTEDYYFHRCLAHQVAGEFEQAEALLDGWRKRGESSERMDQLAQRQLLYSYAWAPEHVLDALRERLGLDFDHQREQAREAARRGLSSVLGPEQVSHQAFEQLLSRKPEREWLANISQAGLWWLCARGSIPPILRKDLLARLDQPHYPGLVELILAELDEPKTSGFDSLEPVLNRSALTLDQLRALAEARPKLRDDASFIREVLTRMQPGPELDLERDREAMAAHLDRLWAFVEPLAPTLNDLKVHVLHNRLDHARRTGTYDWDGFEAYLRLPRQVPYLAPDYRKRHRNELARLAAGWATVTGLPELADDEALVVDYLEQRFAAPDQTDYEAFTALIHEGFLRRVFAEAKLLTGEGERERWYTMLHDPARYDALERRVELEFALDNPKTFAPDQGVELGLILKRVSTLVVKVFELNVAAYFAGHREEVPADVDLDGLIARDERVLEFDAAPLCRHRQTLEFPELAEPGSYIIEVIGGGMSSRALIHKGELDYVERLTSAGHALRIIDTAGQVVEGASVHFGGRVYAADDEGEVRIPYSSGGSSGRVRVLIVAGKLSTVRWFNRRSETYELRASFHVAREQLIADHSATLVIRAALRCQGALVAPSLLDKPTLRITATDRHGTESSVSVPIELSLTAEASHEFRVPPALARLAFELRAKVRQISGQRELELSRSRTIEVNEIDRRESLVALHLAHVDRGYEVWVRGKTGEPRPGLQVNLSFAHEFFVPRLEHVLRSDEQGRIVLGPLPGIVDIRATLDGQVSTWVLPRAQTELPGQLNLQAGENLSLPCPAPREGLAPPALFELRAKAYLRDLSDALERGPGTLRVPGLEPGDYRVVLPGGEWLTILVGGPSEVAGWAVSNTRKLERLPLSLPSIVDVDVDDTRLELELSDADEGTRVHVFASTFVPTQAAQAALRLAALPEPRSRATKLAQARYLSGRDIGDEYRYILERRRGHRYPGNMLERPSLLLNPWELEATRASTLSPRKAGSYAAASAPAPAPAMRPRRAARLEQQATAPSPNYDFLPAPTPVLLNLEPDDAGKVRVARERLAGAQHVELVVANALVTSSRPLALPATALEPRDLRLAEGLDPARHFVKRKQIDSLAPGQELRFAERLSTDHAGIGTLAKVHSLLTTLSNNQTLVEFEWVTRWPELEPARQRELYSNYACHELHLFLARKDPSFFAEVVRPYLANKREQTFLDHYLLGEDLRPYLEPWAYGRLNALERILLAEHLGEQGGEGDDGGGHEAKICARHIAELAELRKPRPEVENAAFEVALSGSALEHSEDAFAELAEKEEEPEPRSELGVLDDDGFGFDEEGDGAAFGGSGGRGGGGPPPPPAAPSSRGRRKKSKRAVRSLERDAKARAQTKPAYRGVDKTKKWAENHYYRVPLANQGPTRIQANPFWRDYAAWLAGGREGPFLSGNFIHACANFSEAMAALALLDLPFTREAPSYTAEGPGAIMQASTAHVVFHAQLAEVELDDETSRPSDLLVAQDYFRADERYRWIEGERHDAPVTGEFLVHTRYLCRVALTNVSAAATKLVLLVQIPRGAMPVADGAETRDLHLALSPHETRVVEYSFYFPAPGAFVHYPAHVSREGQLLGCARAQTLAVVRELSSVDTHSWSHVSQSGSLAEVLAHLDGHNLERIDLERIAWRMREREAYDAILDRLEARHVYAPTLWAYSLLHADEARIGAFLRHQDSVLRSCGYELDSPLVATRAHPRAWYEHFEFAPLVHARAHQLGDTRHIDNEGLAAHYRTFLDTLAYRPRPSAEQLLAATYYLLLQDRIGEAIETLARVEGEQLRGSLQYDYLRAYVALYQEQPATARALAEPHRDHPVERWRKRFVALLELLDELDGAGPQVSDADSREQVQAAAAASEPSLELELEGRELVISYQHIEACTLRYYEMDIELLFSRQPFMRQQSSHFAFVQPNSCEELALDGGQGCVRHPLPPAYHRANAIIEVAGAGHRRSVASFAHELELRIIEAYGQLRVHTRGPARKPLAKAYVKVYARQAGGAVGFYKDGYTDLRGAFDYATLSVGGLESVACFSILIMSEDHGALIREVGPPR